MLFFAASTAAAGARPDAGSFLAEGVSARIQGLGGAGAAVKDGAASILSNPAGTASSRSSFSAYYAPSPLETASLFSAYGRPVGPGYASIGFFQRRSAAIDLFDASANPTGRQSFTDQAFLASFALGRSFPVGFTVKRLQSRFSPYDVAGWGVDVGAQAARGPLSGGLSWQNVGGASLSGDAYFGGTARTRASSKLRTGAALSLARNEWTGLLTADASFSLQTGERTIFYAGAEAWAHDRLALRGGWNGEDGWSVGASVGLSRVRVDYALLLSENAPVLSRLTTQIFFGGAREDVE